MARRLWWLAIAAIACPLGVARAQSQDIGLEFHSLYCVAPTDEPTTGSRAETDEIYVLVAGVRSGRAAFGVRWPRGGAQKESIHGGDWVIERARPWGMWRGYLAPGESVQVLVAVMEGDGGNGDRLLKQGIERVERARAAKETPEATLAAAAAPTGEWSLSALWSRGGDDLVGSFRLTVTNDGGRIVKRLEPVQRAAIGAYENWGALSDTGRAIRMNLGGTAPADAVGHYHATLVVRDRANRPASNPVLGLPYVWTVAKGIGT